MTVQEFNEKYKDFLEEGHYGLAINDADVIDFLDNTFESLTKLLGFQYSQIKLKFSNCRFYSNIDKILPSKYGNIIADQIEKDIEAILQNNEIREKYTAVAMEQLKDEVDVVRNANIKMKEAYDKLKKRFDLYVTTINQLDDFFEYFYKKHDREDIRNHVLSVLDNLTKKLKEDEEKAKV